MIDKHQSLKILAVDDNPHNIQLLGEVLSRESYEFSAALNGQQALENLKYFQPDLILLDIMMPELDGYETCHLIKKQPEYQEIPIIFLTAKNQPEDITHGFQVGAVDYITKPFNKHELLERVKTHIQLKQQKENILKISQDREALIHVLCHDLINPIGSVLTLMQLVADGLLDIHERNSLGIIQKSLQQSLDIIEMVREQRALLSGKYQLNLQKANLLELIQNSLNTMNTKAGQKNIHIEVDIPADIHLLLEKKSFVNTVLNNLLSNAIKFSYENGKIKLYCQKTADSTILFIEDSGIGIPGPLLNDIFDVSKKTTRLGTENEKGTGFGMPLVQKFIHAYGGHIKIESLCLEENQQNHGTTVQLIFPL